MGKESARNEATGNMGGAIAKENYHERKCERDACVD